MLDVFLVKSFLLFYIGELFLDVHLFVFMVTSLTFFPLLAVGVLILGPSGLDIVRERYELKVLCASLARFLD